MKPVTAESLYLTVTEDVPVVELKAVATAVMVAEAVGATGLATTVALPLVSGEAAAPKASTEVTVMVFAPDPVR